MDKKTISWEIKYLSYDIVDFTLILSCIYKRCCFVSRVFAKVRSRSAHMKSHRMNDSDKKPANKKTVPVLDNMLPKMSPNGWRLVGASNYTSVLGLS